jgi:putative ABC transport system permease protein
MSVRIRAGALPEALEQLEEAWSAIAVGYPFNYHFLDQDFERQYVSETRLSTLLIWFAGFALLVTGLGVFALASFTAQQRTKEIGVRKVLGSTISGILLLLSQDFGRRFLVGAVVALPVGHWAILGWLDKFAYRIDPGLPLFGGAAAVVLFINGSGCQSPGVAGGPGQSRRRIAA